MRVACGGQLMAHCSNGPGKCVMGEINSRVYRIYCMQQVRSGCDGGWGLMWSLKEKSHV